METIGKIIGVCSSRDRSKSKENVNKGYLMKGYGLVGDAHAGTRRQVSLLMAEQINVTAQKYHIDIKPGDFAENITTQGIDLTKAKIGDRLKIGEGVIEIVEIGKSDMESHTFSFHGMALLVKNGVFCSVIRSGKVEIGDEIKIES